MKIKYIQHESGVVQKADCRTTKKFGPERRRRASGPGTFDFEQDIARAIREGDDGAAEELIKRHTAVRGVSLPAGIRRWERERLR